MKIIFIISLIIITTNNINAIDIEGYTYLNNQQNHSNIKILLERTVPSILIDSTFTDSTGYYSIDIEGGVYDITFSKELFHTFYLYDQILYSNQSLSDVFLIQIPGILNVPDYLPTIQSAIDFSFDCDTILVQPGTYTENINFNGKNITVASLFLTTQDTSYISQTIIDGDSSGTVVTFNSGEDSTAILSGLTITNGLSYDGGGIKCDSNSTPTLKWLCIINNTADHRGGGICCDNGVSPIKIYNNIIMFNTSNYRGGGISCDNSNLKIYDSILESNLAINGHAGCIHCIYSTLFMQNVEICNNIAYYGGGGILIGYSELDINSSQIINNTTTFDGGGIRAVYTDVCLSESIISNNSGSSGGGFSSYSSSLTITKCLFYNNTSSDDGGAIYCENLSSPIINNSTFSNNIADDNGSCIYTLSSSPPVINNSIIYYNQGNNAVYVSDGTPDITYSDFWENDGGNFYNCGDWVGINVTTNVNGDSCDAYYNIQLNPCFVDTANGDYHLTDISPCIDAGDPTSPLDPDGTIADMGAYYFDQSTIIIPPIADLSSNITEGFEPLTINFNDLSTQGTGIIDEWKWYFGDGDSSYVQNPTHIYSFFGEFDVTLTVTDTNDSTDSITKVGYINVYADEPPAKPSDLKIEMIGNDAVLTWTMVDTTIFGNPTNVDYYLVFYSESVSPDSSFFFHGFTAYTTYTHYAVGQFADNMFYYVVSYIGDIDRLNEIIETKKRLTLNDIRKIMID